MSGILRYAVVLAGPEQFRPVELARALAARRRVPEHDLIGAARRCWGLVELDAAEPEARAEAAALCAAGFEALAVPMGLVESPPAPEPVEALDLAELGRKPPFFVAAAGFRETKSRTVKVKEGPGMAGKALSLGLAMVTGLPGLGPKEREVQKTVESADLVFHADLVFAAPERRLRVAAAAFDYSCLGPKKGYVAAGNFRALLETLSALRPEPALNRGARRLLDGKPPRELGYESLADLDREESWLLTLRCLRRP